MEYEYIRFNVEGGIARLTLNRPQALNALSRPLLRELLDAVDRIPHMNEARVIVLSGEGRAFSSGADLSSGGTPAGAEGFDSGAVLEEYYNPLIQKLFALPIPVVAGVRGAVAGAGCMLALAADITIASRSAFFLQAFVKAGLVPDSGSMWLLPRIIGRSRALAMMMLAERIPAEQARDWGMIYDVVDDDALESRVDEIAVTLSEGPTRAFSLIRNGVAQALQMPLADALVMERHAQRDAGATADFLEGIAAFRERRPPRFLGK